MMQIGGKNESKTCAVFRPRNSGSILFDLRQQHTGIDSGGIGAYSPAYIGDYRNCNGKVVCISADFYPLKGAMPRIAPLRTHLLLHERGSYEISRQAAPLCRGYLHGPAMRPYS